jgi:hypothetical protein
MYWLPVEIREMSEKVYFSTLLDEKLKGNR